MLITGLSFRMQIYCGRFLLDKSSNCKAFLLCENDFFL